MPSCDHVFGPQVPSAGTGVTISQCYKCYMTKEGRDPAFREDSPEAKIFQKRFRRERDGR